MKKTLILALPLFTLLTACGTSSNQRTYVLEAAPGLQSPFSANCTTIEITDSDGANAKVSADSAKQKVITMTVGANKPVTITARCFVTENGEPRETGKSTITAKANGTVGIGSSEGSTDSTFTGTTSGIFPIIRVH